MRSLDMKLIFLIGFCVFWPSLVKTEDEDDQREFYLPYSVTEDVDFSINRPIGMGCYQWSTDAADIVNLKPIFTDYSVYCGSKLEFTISPNSSQEVRDFKIVAENVHLDSEFSQKEIETIVEYTIHMRPVARLEIMGLKSELVVGSDASPFGVTGYDAEDNEFDTLDGLQISWFLGGKRDVADFEPYQSSGPIAKVIPSGSGKGSVIAILSDPNYQNLEPAMLEITIKSNLEIVPDGVYMVKGGKVPLQLFESNTRNNEVMKREIDLSGPSPPFVFMVKEPEIVRLNGVMLTGVQEGETTLLVKNEDNEIIKATPVRVVPVHAIQIMSHPHPQSKQLILGQEYEIKVHLFDRNDRPIYESENILCKITFPSNFEVLKAPENGLSAIVRASKTGQAKVRANLRSVVGDDDEDVEIVPHMKSTTDFEIYQSILLHPNKFLISHDDYNATSMNLFIKASGGGDQFVWTSDNDDIGVVDSEGKVSIHGGPGKLTIRCSMAQSEMNYNEANIYVTRPSSISFDLSVQTEIAVGQSAFLPIKAFTYLPESTEEEPFNECSDLSYQLSFTDLDNFELDRRSTTLEAKPHHACGGIHVRALKPGKSSKITLTYVDPIMSRTLQSEVYIQSYNMLKLVYPAEMPKNAIGGVPELLLPVGSKQPIVFIGGVRPFMGKEELHYKYLDVENPDVLKTTKLQMDGEDWDVYTYEVVCLQLGKSKITLKIGNEASENNLHPSQSVAHVEVSCKAPAKVILTSRFGDDQAMNVNLATGRMMSGVKKDIKIGIIVKDDLGRTFNAVDSLKFDIQVSDASLLKLKDGLQTVKVPVPSTKVHVNGKVFQTFSPSGKVGDVDIRVKLAGYNEKVLQAAQVAKPEPLPIVLDDEDEDFENEVDYANHHHSLKDTLEFSITADEYLFKHTN